ncbi:GTP cyclohydrolase FolE2 [Limisalsivibrio acetivorans]|uniref:GTP cyclohydrolase FolE2 n=1 Tax=Limisalsivibrio acetivorans TaxID=1304888 RepID=UPI0003B5A610|nr:GTP cyclohydrolase FolE2 [Limisalsivibrio acetivorans]
MRDIQNEYDSRNIYIDKVGIKDIVYPIVLDDKQKGKQHTNARINMYVRLPHDFKGTHMSRFVEVLNRHREKMGISSVWDILKEMREKLESEESHIELFFKYFVEKTAPVSGLASMMDYTCEYYASSTGEEKDFILCVKVPVMTLCPCSKEISCHGAHNQRGEISIKVRFRKMLWIEELIDIAESSASSPVYPLLKREDEKFVTEKSYENPAFVEDVVRNCAEKLMKEPRIDWFEVSSENFESIHNHSAYAVIVRDKRNQKALGESGRI